MPEDDIEETTELVLVAVVGKRLREELADLQGRIESWRKRNDTTFHDYQGP